MATALEHEFDAEAPGGGEVMLVPINYREYYEANLEKNLPIDFVMDLFKTADRNGGVAVKTQREHNSKKSSLHAILRIMVM
jgi:hypothetical protein